MDPARLLIPLSLSIAVLAGITVNTINKKWLFVLLCSITVFYTILNWGNRTTIPTINDQVLAKENAVWPALGTVGLEPSSPIWANFNENLSFKKRSADIETLYGDTNIKLISRGSINHKYIIDVKSDSARIKENTLYFPGWILKINGQQSFLDYQSLDNMGVITFKLKKGVNKVELLFVDTLVRKIANFISFIAVITFLVYLIKKLLHIFKG